MGTAATPLASGSAPQSWEALPDSAQRIYLALAGGDEEQARQLLKSDRRTQRRPRRGRADPESSAARRDRRPSRPAPGADPGRARDRKASSSPASAKSRGKASTRATAKTKLKPDTDVGTRRGKAGAGSATSTTSTLDLRGFVERRKGHFEPPEMRAVEAWKRRLARS